MDQISEFRQFRDDAEFDAEHEGRQGRPEACAYCQNHSRFEK